ncbi:MAG TPA: four helix bundle protein [Cyclobacteriaceae bacterium]
MRDFKKLLVWQKGMEIAEETSKASNDFPSEEKYGLRSEIIRSAVTIHSSIAEASAKSSEHEYKQHIEIALGSSFELETKLLVVQRLGWLKEEVVRKLLAMIIEEQRMLASLWMKLKFEAAYNSFKP